MIFYYSEKTKTACKKISKEDETLSTETESVSFQSLVEVELAASSTDIHKEYSSSNTIPENNTIMLINDIEAADLLPNINKLVLEKDKEEEIVEVSVVESIVTAQVEARFNADKKQNNQSNVSHSAENIRYLKQIFIL